MNRKYRNLTFFIILLFVAGSFAVSLYALRQNNLQMNELRTAVLAADKKGNKKQLIATLSDLRRYVLRHMNTDLQPEGSKFSEKPIQLPYKYYRDTLRIWYDEIKEAGVDKEVLDDAREVCETDSYVISERLNCLFEQTREVQVFPEPNPPIKDYYVFDFPSPSWSPDLAGMSLAVFFISLAVLVLRLLF